MPREGARKIAVVLIYLLVVVLVLGKIARAGEANPDEVKVEIVPIDIATQMVVDFGPVFQSLANSVQKFLVEYWWMVGIIFIVSFIGSWHQGALSAKYVELHAYEEREARILKEVANLEEKDEAKRRYEEQKAERERQLHQAEVKQMEDEASMNGFSSSIRSDDGRNVERHTVWSDSSNEGDGTERQVYYSHRQEVTTRVVNGEREFYYHQTLEPEVFEGDEPADQVMRLVPSDEEREAQRKAEEQDMWQKEVDKSFDSIVTDIANNPSEPEDISAHRKRGMFADQFVMDTFRLNRKKNRVVRQPYYDDCGY